MIRLLNVCRNFQVGDETVHALRDLDLEIMAGEYLSIMGPSGSGKSTLLNIIGLLDRPNQGEYILNDISTSRLDEAAQASVRRDQIGFVFQAFHLVPRLTAAENIGLPLLLAGIEPEEREQRVDDILQTMGLADRGHHRPDQLSGGQRQRVAIARATIMRPSILLADEPTGNLDKHSGDDVIAALEQLNRDGITLIIVTHDPAVGERARRRVHMVDGSIETDHAH